MPVYAEEPLPHSISGSTTASHHPPPPPVGESYSAERIIGNGSFGIVYLAEMQPSKSMRAIKKVFQDKRYRNREVQILTELNDGEGHPNIIKLTSSFHSQGDRPDELFLNLVMEYIPETLYNTARNLRQECQGIVPDYFIMIYTFQLLRALAHLRAHQIMHRDIKPQNLLVNAGNNHILKLCDFGSAKKVQSGNDSVQYICSRYYRAPELIFGSVDYGCPIDMWSAGCVMGELINNGQPIFPGTSGVDQLVEIIKVLGTPSREEIDRINPGRYSNFTGCLDVKARGLTDILPVHVRRKEYKKSNVEFLSMMLRIDPYARLKPLDGLASDFFAPIRSNRFFDTPIGSQIIPNGIQKWTAAEKAQMTDHQRAVLLKKPNATGGRNGL